MIAGSVGVIGAGKMGEAIIHGLLSSGSYGKDRVSATEVIDGRRRYIQEAYGIRCSPKIGDTVRRSNLIIIAVKPDDLPPVARDLGKMIGRKALVSIAAGVRMESISPHLQKGSQLIRVMPNLACYAREGMLAISPSANAKPEVIDMVRETLGLLGRTVIVEEKLMDAITGLVGSGPAYIYMVIDGLADAGLRLGIPKALSLTLAAQTTLGASKMILETGRHPSSLRDDVATPAGTTVEGLLALERGGLKGLLIDAVSSAANRSRELQRR